MHMLLLPRTNSSLAWFHQSQWPVATIGGLAEDLKGTQPISARQETAPVTAMAMASLQIMGAPPPLKRD